MPKRAIVALISLVLAFLLWILLLNIALWTGFVAWAVTGSYRMTRLELDYGRAYVLWPTQVHVEDFRLLIDGYRYQLELEIPRGELDIALFELLSRRFHAYSITGEDASAIFRFKAPEEKVSDERRAVFGPIEGAVEPVRLFGPPNIPDVEKAWEVHLESVDGQFDSLWINELNFTPIDARLRGGLRSRSAHLFALDDVTLEVASGELHVGDELLAQNWSGALWAEVIDYHPHLMMQRAPLQQLNVQLDAGADVVSLAALDPFLARKPLRVRGGEGPLDIALDVQRGRLGPNTEILYSSDEVRGSFEEWRGTTAMRFAFGVDERARAAVELHDVSVRREDKEPIVAEHLAASIVTTETDLTADKLKIVGFELDAPKVVVRDAATVGKVGKALELREGGLQLGIHTEMVKPGHLTHELDVRLKKLLVSAKDSADVRASGRLTVNARTDNRFRSGEVKKAHLAITDLAIRSKHGRSECAWLEVKEGNVTWKRDEIDGRVKGRLDDLRPILAHLDDRKRAVELVPDLGLTSPFDFDLELHAKGQEQDLLVHRLDRPGLHISGIVHKIGKRSRSAFRLRLAQLGIVRDETKERNIDAGANEEWLERRISWARALPKKGR